MNTEIDNLLFNTNSLLQYDSNQVQAAIASLEKYMTLAQSNNRMFESGVKLKLTGEYNDVSMKRSMLAESDVQKAKFINVSLTSSYLSDVHFRESQFDESNMQHCQFVQNTFKDINIHSTNLSYSNFYSSNFEHVTFKGATVSEIIFEQCTFEHCIFTSSMLENTLFSHCVFIDVQFINANIEYMELRNCKFDKVCLPMAQVPYVFGLFQNLSEFNNNIELSADNQTISLEEYRTLKESLITYYTSISEYFPLANIFLANNEIENAYYCISMGMKKAIIQRNFRMLKFFCKQAKQGNILDYGKLKALYILIEEYVAKQALDIYEQRSFVYNIGEIRTILLEQIYDFPSIRITMQTNIDSSESTKILQFVEYIDSVINDLCTQKISHIEYRHNSDANFVAYISAHYAEILLIANTLLVLSGNIVDAVQKKIINHQQIVLNQLEIREKRKKLEKAENKSKELKSNDIHYTVQYIIDSPILDSENMNIYL